MAQRSASDRRSRADPSPPGPGPTAAERSRSEPSDAAPTRAARPDAPSTRPRRVDAPRRSRPLLQRWLALSALLFVPSAAWTIATPLFAAPDEPAHAIKAVSIWYGQLAGTDRAMPNGTLATEFTVPAMWVQAHRIPECFAFKPDTTAECSAPFDGPPGDGTVTTTAGHYPPAYYAAIGWAGRAVGGRGGVLVMRLVGAAASAALLAWAVRALSAVMGPALALAAVLCAMTPMAWFLTGVVNPNGVEIAAAIATWASALGVVRARPSGNGCGPSRTALARGLALTGAVLAFTRSLSPLFVACIVVFVALTAEPATRAELWRDRRLRLPAAVLFGATALAAVFVAGSGHLSYTPGQALAPGEEPLRAALAATDSYLLGMVGNFGWADTGTPVVMLYAWLTAALLLVGVAAVTARRRDVVVLGLVALSVFLLPLVLQLPRAATQGLPWQGRYALPIAAGLPLLAAVAVTRSALWTSPSGPGTERRLAIGVAASASVAGFTGFVWTLRRYVSGVHGEVPGLLGAWQPPLGSVAIVTVVAVWSCFVVALCARTSAAGSELSAALGTPTRSTPEATP